MRTHYVGCFKKGDGVEKPLLKMLGTWAKPPQHVLTQEVASDGEDLKARLLALLGTECPDVLIIGAHGHDSLMGFIVQSDPVAWFDLALLLRGRLAKNCTFVFYSCNGAYPGIAHVFGRTGGPDFVFGPRVQAIDDAMTYATQMILKWKEAGAVNLTSARKLVDDVHKWAAKTYPNSNYKGIAKYDHSFLRVIWNEGTGRYPANPGPDKPDYTKIKIRGWGWGL
jgi:hypothetical protein